MHQKLQKKKIPSHAFTLHTSSPQVSSPSCDSQGLNTEEAPPSEPQSPVTQTSNGAARPTSCLTPLSLVSRVKTEQPASQPEAATPYSVVCTPVAKRLWEGGSSRDGGGAGAGGGGGGGGARKAARYSQETVRGSAIQSPSALGLAMGMGSTASGLGGMVGGGGGLTASTGTNGSAGVGHGMSEGASPGTLSTYASDSPISYHDDEEEEEGADESAEEQYRQICNMYTMYSMLNMGAAGSDARPGAPRKCSFLFSLPLPSQHHHHPHHHTRTIAIQCRFGLQLASVDPSSSCPPPSLSHSRRRARGGPAGPHRDAGSHARPGPHVSARRTHRSDRQPLPPQTVRGRRPC